MSNIQEINDQGFNVEVLEAKTPVLVDFWAPWCAPCRAIAPLVEQISKEFDGKVKVVKMNIDDNPQTPSQLGIRSIPTLKLFKAGKEVDQMIGSGSKEQLSRFIQQNL